MGSSTTHVLTICTLQFLRAGKQVGFCGEIQTLFALNRVPNDNVFLDYYIYIYIYTYSENPAAETQTFMKWPLLYIDHYYRQAIANIALNRRSYLCL